MVLSSLTFSFKFCIMVYTCFTGILLSLMPLNSSVWECYTISVCNTCTIYLKFLKPQKFTGQFQIYYQQDPFLWSTESGLLTWGPIPVDPVYSPMHSDAVERGRRVARRSHWDVSSVQPWVSLRPSAQPALPLIPEQPTDFIHLLIIQVLKSNFLGRFGGSPSL